MTLYRQGDVLIRAVTALPTRTEIVPPEGGRIVLAHGEVTGHAHTLAADTCILVQDPTTQRRYLTVEAQMTRLLHEEHDPITIPAGIYEIIRQREYAPDAIRTVAD